MSAMFFALHPYIYIYLPKAYHIFISLILCKIYLSLFNAIKKKWLCSPSTLVKTTRFQCYKYTLNHPSERFIISILYTLLLLNHREFIIPKQEQILLFLEFKTHYLIYCNHLFKSYWFHHMRVPKHHHKRLFCRC